MDGLLLRQHSLEGILSGEKIWELRGQNTHKRDMIALIQTGTGLIMGVAYLNDVHGPFSKKELREYTEKHRLSAKDVRALDHPKMYAWEFSEATRLYEPVPYDHAGGGAWVKLTTDRVKRVMNRARDLPKGASMRQMLRSM